MRSVAESEGSNGSVKSRLSDTAPLKSGLFSVFSIRAWIVPLVVSVMVAGCSAYKPYIPTSKGHIGLEKPKPKPEADRVIPPPARATTFVPPPKPTVKPQTYTVVVNEVQVKDLLLALARDTKQNIDIHPGITGLVSLNAVNQTLPAILERIAKQVNMRYRVEGNTIIVSPNVPYVKTYRIGYVNMVRDTTSTIGVSGEIGSASGGPTPAGGGGGSSTTVRTTSRNNFWEQLRENIRSILNSTRLQSLNAEDKAERLAQEKQVQEMRTKQIEAASRAGQGAPTLASSVITATGGAQRGSLLPDDVVVSSVSGTVTVNATEKQHQLIQRHIDSIVTSMQRQVLIEATIVEVQLSNAYQSGIDWSRVSQSGGVAFSTLGALAGFGTVSTGATIANLFALTYNENNVREGQIQLTVKLLEAFGNTKVLSSPKLMALNNQTALLKVVDNVVYFEVKSDTTQNQTNLVTNFSTTAKTVAVGVVMGVTPQINDDNRISVIVRPTITRLNPIKPFVNDPNPSLCDLSRNNCVVNQVPQVQVREMESVLQVANGQTVILGGLMQDNVKSDREQVPFVGNIPDLGEAFALKKEEVTKTELVIFLRTTIVNNPTLESDQLKFFKRFLPEPETKPDLSTVPKDLRPPPPNFFIQEPAGAAQ
ncbi:MAG: Type II secretory pathway component PulD [Betaproteobacteria bacterium]|nr:Type II secretory pathway component PulD [Betaproteobacteria bacterium]MDH3435595.1 Type II secretory pathway component PulD [Betaproteobacteria bacterium]